MHVMAIVEAKSLHKTHMLHQDQHKLGERKRLPMRQLVKAAIIDRISSVSSFLHIQKEEKNEKLFK